MSIMIEQNDGLTIVRILTDSVDALSAKEIEQAAGQLREVTVLDFGKVLFINSAGISALLKLVIEARKQGKKLYAINVTAHHRKVFEMVDMLRYMPVTTLEDLAVEAQTAARGGRRWRITRRVGCAVFSRDDPALHNRVTGKRLSAEKLDT